jgi:hypothetical protein
MSIGIVGQGPQSHGQHNENSGPVVDRHDRSVGMPADEERTPM